MKCSLPKSTDIIKPTGIPPHVLYMSSLTEISQNIEQIIPAIEQSSQNAVTGIMEIIEDRALTANTVTRTGLLELMKNSLTEMMDENGILDLTTKAMV